MSDDDLTRRRLMKLLKTLRSRRRDIAWNYKQLGEHAEAAKWLMEAARQMEWSEQDPMLVAEEAVSLVPDDLAIRREYPRLAKKFGPRPRGKLPPDFPHEKFRMRPGRKKPGENN